MGFLETALIVSIVVVASLASQDGQHHRRSYTINPGKVGEQNLNIIFFYSHSHTYFLISFFDFTTPTIVSKKGLFD